MSTVAPYCSSERTMPTSPCRAAACSGVSPFFDLTSGLAPPSSSTAATAEDVDRVTATSRGVRPRKSPFLRGSLMSMWRIPPRRRKTIRFCTVPPVRLLIISSHSASTIGRGTRSVMPFFTPSAEGAKRPRSNAMFFLTHQLGQRDSFSSVTRLFRVLMYKYSCKLLYGTIVLGGAVKVRGICTLKLTPAAARP